MLKKPDIIVASAVLALIVYTLGLSVLALGQTSRTVQNTGTVKTVGVGVYWDSGCTSQVSSINWTVLEPGQRKNQTVYVKNTSNVPVTLSMITQNWNPTNASSYIACTWDSEGKSLSVNQVTPAVLTLSVNNTIAGITNFSFDIVIIGTG